MRKEPRSPIKGGMTEKGPCPYCGITDAPLNQTAKSLSIEDRLHGATYKSEITCLKCGHHWEYQIGGIA